MILSPSTPLSIHPCFTPTSADIALPTKEIPVDKTCAYDDVIKIDHFEKGFETAGGINMPRILQVVGTNGKVYKQVCKVNILSLKVAQFSFLIGVVVMLLN